MGKTGKGTEQNGQAWPGDSVILTKRRIFPASLMLWQLARNPTLQH
jgi:hypothetical protein